MIENHIMIKNFDQNINLYFRSTNPRVNTQTLYTLIIYNCSKKKLLLFLCSSHFQTNDFSLQKHIFGIHFPISNSYHLFFCDHQVNSIYSLSINFCKIILLPLRFVNIIQVFSTLFLSNSTPIAKCWLKFQDWSSLYFNKHSLPVTTSYIYIYGRRSRRRVVRKNFLYCKGRRSICGHSSCGRGKLVAAVVEQTIWRTPTGRCYSQLLQLWLWNWCNSEIFFFFFFRIDLYITLDK